MLDVVQMSLFLFLSSGGVSRFHNSTSSFRKEIWSGPGTGVTETMGYIRSCSFSHPSLIRIDPSFKYDEE